MIVSCTFNLPRLLRLSIAAGALASVAAAQTNLALNGTAAQSTTDYGGLASRANDGNTDPLWMNQSISHTGNTLDSWWEVDLGATFTIGEVRLYNRGDCCWPRLSNFRVSIFDGATEVFGQDFFTGSGGVGQGGTPAGIHRVLPLGGVTGDRVRVRFLGLNNLGNGFLHLAEVEVYDHFIGVNYCGPAVANSTGSSANLSASGSATAADNDVTLTASDLPAGSFGFYLTSQMQALVPQPGGSQGDLCLGGSIGRYVAPGQIQNSGPQGSFDLVLDLTQTPTPTGLVSVIAGETWNFQCWFRDAVGGSATSNFTDGLSVAFQ